MGYDEQYADLDAVFGTEPEATLVDFSPRLPAGAVVLDIGAGQGRNTLYLARRGVEVHALEPSVVAAEALRRQVAESEFPAEIFTNTFEEFAPAVDHYAGILVFGLTPDLAWSAIGELVKSVRSWGAPGSLLWITGFTTDDPAHDRIRATWTTIGSNSYRKADGHLRTYLEPGQILGLLPDYTVLHHWEGLGPEHRHGDGPPERHGRFEAVLQQPVQVSGRE